MRLVFNPINVTTSRVDDKIEVRELPSGRLLFTVKAEGGQLEQQLSAYCSGLLVGIEAGKAQLQEEIRNVLGII